MSLGMDYGDEYEYYVDNMREEQDDNVLTFEEWLQDKAERAEWMNGDRSEDRGTERE